MPIARKTLVKEIIKSIQQNSLAVFAGAGLSMSAGFVNWKELLRDIADEIELSVDKESDLVTLAQYYFNKSRGRGKLNDILRDNFNPLTEPTENHRILARLPIDTYWTTNYDKLIERSLEQANKLADVKMTTSNLNSSIPYADVIVYKMHGDVQHVDNTILIKEDYETYDKKYSLFREILEGNLVSKTFLFIGLSFSDPNLDYVLAHLSSMLNSNNKRTHYCILKKVSRDDYTDEEDFNYDSIKQRFQVEDLKRFGIKTLLINDYGEITSILREIEKTLKREVVFISGSAYEYSAFSSQENLAKDFIYKLSEKLVENKYKIASGYGFGVGDYVLNGSITAASRHLKSQKERRDVVKIYPFPQNINEKDKEQKWLDYRESIMSEVGYAIFIFGNKKIDDSIVNANGVYEEFEIAKKYGVIPIPIGLTGYMAKEIYDEVSTDLSEYYSNVEEIQFLFKQLGDLNCKDVTQEQVDEIIEVLVQYLKKAKGKI